MNTVQEMVRTEEKQAFTWFSPLSPDVCVRRLEAQLQPGSPSGKPLWGRVKEMEFSLRLGHGLRNPFAPYIRGTLKGQDGGTLVSGTCGVLPGPIIGAGVWAVLWILMPCAMIAIVDLFVVGLLLTVGESLRQLGDDTFLTLLTFPVMSLSFPALGLLVALGFPALFILLRRGDCDQLTTRLQQALEITEETDSETAISEEVQRA